MPLAKFQLQIVAQLAAMSRLSEEQVATLSAHPEELSVDALTRVLQDEYRITSWQCLVAKARAVGLAPYNLNHYRFSARTFERLEQPFCEENCVLPLGEVGSLLLVATHNPFDTVLPARIQEITGRKVIRLLVRERDLRDRLAKLSQRATGFDEVVEQIGVEFGAHDGDDGHEVTEESGPIIQLANRMIEDAFFSGASDIHIEPQEKEVIVRVRVDGVCAEKLRLPKRVGPALVARLKIMCNLDISERRLPQDGRIVFKQYSRRGLDLDLRVSTAPLNHGEGVVMRILDKQKTTLPLPALGFSAENLAKYRELIRQPYGMILHCGPTGSGKSMTLYSALNEINTPDVVIRTAEDPIEYTLPGLNQMQMHRQIGLTFATALRSFLRQDPDIILVGEIRDRETAGIAIEAALTGHLLLSTLHTNDAPTTISRLTEMGIEPFMVSSSLLCVCAQRLLRRVCKTCRMPTEPQGREKDILEKAIGWSGPVYRANPKGCPNCGGHGYRGRVGIHELMASSEALVDAINREAEASEIKRIALAGGMKSLHQDSMLKVKEGVTTLEEAIANVPPDF